MDFRPIPGKSVIISGRFGRSTFPKSCVRPGPSASRRVTSPKRGHVYLGFQPREAVIRHLDQCCAGLVLFHPERDHVDAQPNKMFEYMAAGLPVIASDFPLWRQLVEEPGCGLTVDPLDPAAIAAAMRRLTSDPAAAAAMGERGRAAVRGTLNWEHESRALLALYACLLGSAVPAVGPEPRGERQA
jgi:glycosyltransferase involved in cell wall biosynthesis